MSEIVPKIGDEVWVDCFDSFGPGVIVDIRSRKEWGSGFSYIVDLGDGWVDPFSRHEIFYEEIKFEDSIFNRQASQVIPEA